MNDSQNCNIHFYKKIGRMPEHTAYFLEFLTTYSFCKTSANPAFVPQQGRTNVKSSSILHG
ncbi:MAG TPA: hypothetical protein PKL56_21015, partial [Cyclobacteriaceae bacterium]|nr:hypothetical protein [Cyclobacteriaceae bacterium]